MSGEGMSGRLFANVREEIQARRAPGQEGEDTVGPRGGTPSGRLDALLDAPCGRMRLSRS